MEILKKIWNFLFGKKKEPVVVEETPVEEEVIVGAPTEVKVESVDHCSGHTRYRVNCDLCNAAIR